MFKGRARRKEYWYFVLFNTIISILLSLIDTYVLETNAETGVGILGGLYSLAVFLPSLGVLIRRLHDTGRSGWWIFINLIPLIGSIILLVFLVEDSKPGDNQYGPNPKVELVTTT